MLDYLAESVSSSDLSKLHDDVDFLALIKDIAQTKDWPNNQSVWPVDDCDFREDHPRSRLTQHNLRPGNHHLDCAPHGRDRLHAIATHRAGHAHGSLSSMDTRLMCDNPTCINVEKDEVKFGKCSNCKRVAYCCTGCQLAHWKSIHKRACGQ